MEENRLEKKSAHFKYLQVQLGLLSNKEVFPSKHVSFPWVFHIYNTVPISVAQETGQKKRKENIKNILKIMSPRNGCINMTLNTLKDTLAGFFLTSEFK